MIISSKKNKAEKLVNRLKNTFKANKNKFMFLLVILLIVASISGYYFVCNNEAYYKKTIAKITAVSEKEDSLAYDINGKAEQIYSQAITAVIMNGVDKGEVIQLENKTSYSKVYDLSFKVKDEVFVLVTKDVISQKISSAQIIDLKRDKYLAYISILFILLIILIGGFKGLRSLTSVIVNIVIFSIVIELYFKGFDLVLTSIVASIFFIIISILLVSGVNKKSASAVIGTMVGTLFSMLITVIVILATKANGLHYEEMEFVARPPEPIFIVEILIGTLGGIMDIAISISSAINEIYDRNPGIERKALIKSGMEIGKDIMGTMANTLIFAYISGSIPMILLWLKNGYSSFEIININISFEIIRALTGSIGIVISIPITLYISVMLLRRNKIEEA